MVAFAPEFGSNRASPLALGRFEQMIPLILHHSRPLFRDAESSQLAVLLDEVVTNAFDIFTRLAERGLGDLAYPKPLALAALAQMKQNELDC